MRFNPEHGTSQSIPWYGEVSITIEARRGNLGELKGDSYRPDRQAVENEKDKDWLVLPDAGIYGCRFTGC